MPERFDPRIIMHLSVDGVRRAERSSVVKGDLTMHDGGAQLVRVVVRAMATQSCP